jgi:Cdc6-like AAA superfamily ATPase
MNRKEKFKKWLKIRVETIAPLSSYPNAIENFIPKKLIEIRENKYNNLFDCTDLNYLEKLYKRLLNGGDLHKFNVSTQSRVPSAAIDKYIEFLKFGDIEVEEPIEPIDNNITKNIILYGAPGVGKTHNYQRIISMIENGKKEKEIFNTVTNNKSSLHVELNSEAFQAIKDEKRVEFVTFHQSYSYEDFIEGFRPSENNIKLENGIFKNLCDEASKSKQNFYIVIDEINRGNISKIFGELITLIEEDKRDKYEVTLPYSKEPFKIPSNLYIIATMNSTDKSIATIDIALRRRFTFLKMKPNLELVKNDEAKKLMEKLNKFIGENLSEDYMLGHSYFMGEEIDLEFIKEYKIKPLLEEYFYADEEKLKEVLGKLNSLHAES